ncbi:MAG: M16 family metallopeptidase [Vicinamibacterales bacterium]
MTSTLARGLSPVRAQLSNGAVVTVQETSMTPAVTISAAFRAGSMFDPADLPGLSYLTGRIIDRGTERRIASAIADELDNRGVSLKVSTNRHQLTLSCTCLSEDFDEVLAIVADVARRPTFPEEEIVKRRAETVTILRQREDNPASRAVDGVLELLYTRHHPYGRSSKGTADGVERVTRAEMVGFHQRRVRPAILSLAIVGDIPPALAIERAGIELDGWTADVPPTLDIPPTPGIATRRQRFIAMPGKSQTDIAYAFTGVRRLDSRYYAYWMMNNILGQFGLGGRLADNIRERQGMAYYAFSTLDSGTGEAPILIRAGVDPANVDRALEAIDHEVGTLAAGGPTATELEETRAYLVGSIPRMFETNEGIASFLQATEEYGLGLDFDHRLPALLNDVTFEEVRAAAETLDPNRAAVAIAGPATNGAKEP